MNEITKIIDDCNKAFKADFLARLEQVERKYPSIPSRASLVFGIIEFNCGLNKYNLI